MAEKNGTIVTLGMDVAVEYICSACGRENRLSDVAQVTGSMASIRSLNKAGKGRDILPLLPGGPKSAGLQCRCGCGHREPWAMLRNPLLDRVQKYALWALAILAAAAYLLHTGEGPLTAVLLALMALAAATLCAASVWKLISRGKAEKAMAELPETAFPKVYLR